MYEQRDAAEYFEKILSHTSPEASRVITLSYVWNLAVIALIEGSRGKLEILSLLQSLYFSASVDI